MEEQLISKSVLFVAPSEYFFHTKYTVPVLVCTVECMCVCIYGRLCRHACVNTLCRMLTTSIWHLLAQLFCQLHVVIVWNGMTLLPYTLFLGQFGLGLALPARTDLTETCWDEITYTRDLR